MNPDVGKPELELAKKIAHEVWQKYDDAFGYRTEKQEYNAKVSAEIPDNLWFFWGQFDSDNHKEFLDLLCAKYHKDPGAPKLILALMPEMEREQEAVKKLREDYGFEI